MAVPRAGKLILPTVLEPCESKNTTLHAEGFTRVARPTWQSKPRIQLKAPIWEGARPAARPILTREKVVQLKAIPKVEIDVGPQSWLFSLPL